MMLLANINETMEKSEKSCLVVKEQYNKNSYLWNTDLNQFFDKFVKASQITTETGSKLLDLKKFEDEIVKYEG